MVEIKIEDTGFAEDASSRSICGAVLMEFALFEDGTAELWCEKCFEAHAREFALLFGDNPLSDNARDHIYEKAAKFFDDYKMVFDEASSRTVNEYLLTDAQCLPSVELSHVTLSENGEDIEKYPNDTDSTVDPGEMCAAYIDGGRILCVAGINDYSDSELTEVNVECALNSRGRGYAKSALTSLCARLISEGDKVSYKTYAENIPSNRLALSCGFRRVCRRMSIVGYFE